MYEDAINEDAINDASPRECWTSPFFGTIYQEALTHKSWTFEHGGVHNERLEFLGDSVLQIHVTELLFHSFPDFSEGELSRMRHRLVSTTTLARLSRERGLGNGVRLGKGERATGGGDRDRLLAGLFEALLGAIHLDQGSHASAQVIAEIFSPLLSKDLEHRNVRALLQEWAQRKYQLVPDYKVIKLSGPPHARIFLSSVSVLGEELGQGQGNSKRKAFMEAARAAVQKQGLG